MSAIAESATTCVMSVSDNVLRVVVPTFCSYRIRAVVRIVCNYYPNVTTLLPGLCYRKSVCRLSVVCNVRDPYSLSAIFLCHFVYLSHPLTSVQNFMEIVPGEPPPVGGVKRKRGSKMSRSGISSPDEFFVYLYVRYKYDKLSGRCAACWWRGRTNGCDRTRTCEPRRVKVSRSKVAMTESSTPTRAATMRPTTANDACAICTSGLWG